jgi:hypothetical protein
MEVVVYLLHDFNENLLNEKTVLLSNYSSKNEFYDEYKKEDDRPEIYEDLKALVKASPSSLFKVFVYGTLKTNEPNHQVLVENNAIFLSKAVTVDKWPLTIATNRNSPFLLYKKGFGKVILY